MRHLVISTHGEDSSKRTTFRNPNEELKKKISEFKLSDKEKSTTRFMGDDWNIEEWEEDEVRCTFERNVMYIKRSDIEREHASKLEMQRGLAFPMVDYFKDMFGVLVYKTSTKVKKLDMVSVYGLCGSPYNPTSINGYGRVYEAELDTYRSLTVKLSASNGMGLFLSFDADGNVSNRDYNEELQNYKASDDKLISIFDNWTKVIRSRINGPIYTNKTKTRYFTDAECLTPYFEDNGQENFQFGLYTLKVSDKSGVYKEYRSETVKLPAKPIETTVDDLINHVKGLLTPEAMDILNK